MNKGAVDVVWRGLNAAAVTRSASRCSRVRTSRPPTASPMPVLTGLRVLAADLVAAPRRCGPTRRCGRPSPSPCKATERSDSIVPGGVPGHMRRRFPLGGKATPKVTWKTRIQLTLGYDSTDARTARTSPPRSGPGWRTPVGSASGCDPAMSAPTSTWWTARRGRRPRWPGCSHTWTPRCRPSRSTVRASRSRSTARPPIDATADQLLAQPAAAGRHGPDRAADQPGRRARVRQRRACRSSSTSLRAGLAARSVRDQQWLIAAPAVRPALAALSGVRRGPLRPASGSP